MGCHSGLKDDNVFRFNVVEAKGATIWIMLLSSTVFISPSQLPFIICFLNSPWD